MSKSWFRRPDHCISVQIFVVACFAASLAHYGCEAQFLLNDGGGLSVLPPGLRLSQGGFSFPRPGLFGARSFTRSTSDTVTADTATADSPAPSPAEDASQGTDSAADPPPSPPPAPPPPPPAATTYTPRYRGRSSSSNATAPASGPAATPALAPSTAVSFSELIASTAMAPAPHVHGTSAAPGPQQGLNASSAPDQPTQITDLLAPAPAGGQTPPPAVPPTRGGEDPRTNPQSGRSRGDTCENQGLSGQCNECICCCIPSGSGGFWRYVPTGGGCDCKKIVSTSDIWTALSLAGIAFVPAVFWTAYFLETFKISPYKPRVLLPAVAPAAQNAAH